MSGPLWTGPWLPRAAALRPEHPALIADGETLTYADLHARAVEAAAWLQAKGVEEGDRVALALPAGVPFAVALHAILLTGAAAMPIDPRLGRKERALRQRTASLVVEEPIASDGAAAEMPPRWAASMVATVIHTSGTTAEPKPVELTVGNWVANALGSALALGLDPQDRWLCTLPLSHVGGLSILIRSALYATTVVLHERFDPQRAKRAIEEDAITVTSLVPTTLERLLDAGLAHPPSLRVALIGGGPLAPALAARAKQAGIPVAQTYGMTEACSQVATSLPGEPETAGRPLYGTEVQIAGAPRASAGEPVVGEILVQGPTVAPGAASEDGWLHTGDLGALDSRGRLTVTGRKADTIVSGGENVAPAEVEAVLLQHPAVADAAVHGRPDPEWGEAVVATVVLRDGDPTDEKDLRAHVAASLAAFKVPKHIAFADSLPRTASGKLIRRELSAR
jgi:O-succinylbenzoic acid--CoA ligase